MRKENTESDKTVNFSISRGLPESMLDDLRVLANKRDVPYQSLIKMILQERIDKELKSAIAM